jgi:hypothetical protein
MCIIEKFISSQIEKVGQYRANQFWIEIGHLEFIKTLDKVRLEVCRITIKLKKYLQIQVLSDSEAGGM